ncbi:hypothetical protein [Thermococcus barossii]|nr:hypothetical protein [Thermococcus barossii]
MACWIIVYETEFGDVKEEIYRDYGDAIVRYDELYFSPFIKRVELIERFFC